MAGISRELIMRALRRLGELALAEGLLLEICLYGGTAMMLAYDNRETTQDVDATINPKEAGLRLAKGVAQELNLEEDWLNDEVWRFFAPVGARRLLPIDIPGLKLYVATANYLLAMKALACREPGPSRRGDLHDLKFLIRKMEIKSLEDIQRRIDQFFPDDIPTEKAQKHIRKIIEEVAHEPKT
jgi:predicted nucleotidyltransferase